MTTIENVLRFCYSLTTMEIRYLGHSSFLIKTKEAKLVTDPFDSSIGMNFSKQEADVVTASHQHPDHNNIKAISGDPLVIEWPGEYEKKGIRVFGYKWYHDDKKGEERGENILYKIEAEGISILHCGDLGAPLNDALLEEIGSIDILMIPVGGHYTIDASTATGIIKKIEPNIVIPMHYNHDKLDQKTYEKVAGVDEFLKEMGTEKQTPLDKLVVKKEDLNEEEMKVVVMQIS
jgi:L-ascorbate metabolism protein UlaG (beta-lactamase superfamily)